MENLGKVTAQIRNRVWLVAPVLQLPVGVVALLLYHYTNINALLISLILVLLEAAAAYGVAWIAGYFAAQPLAALGQAVLHIAPGDTGVKAPQFDSLRIGREYVTTLAYQLYQIASLQDNKILAEHRREATQASNILTHLPLPLLVFNREQIVTFSSDSGLAYFGRTSAELFGKPLFEGIDLEFPSDFTLETWIIDCQKNKATDTAYWRRVRLHLKDEAETLRQCDIAGYYNRDNPTGIEFIITLFDKTKEYSQDDQALSFVALAVHELRTPLTLMRGYIEVFDDELKGKLDAEMATFVDRLQAAAQQLSAFVNNILNVARVEENQLAVKLDEEKWPEVLQHAGGDMQLRATTLGKTITYDIEKDLPTVAADSVTIYEVVSNLLDNAIKYSAKSKEIQVKSYKTKDGLVETTVHDFGVGIPANVMSSLFEKFHRSHRNRDQIAGSGLGLYLSKAIVNAHGGDIWVKSKEGEGSTFGFTLKPYSMLAAELKSGNNEMVRTAHGWIKNHSLYRR